MRNYQRTTDTNKYGKCGHIPRNPALWLLYINKVMLCCRPGSRFNCRAHLGNRVHRRCILGCRHTCSWLVAQRHTLQVTPENTWRQRDTCRLPHCSSSCLANAKHCVRTFLFFLQLPPPMSLYFHQR